MRIKIPYGRGEISLNILDKNILDIVSGEIGSSKLNEDRVIKKALRSPIESKKLSEIAMNRKSACIIASDITRPCPSYKFLPDLIEELNEGGIKNRNIKIVLGLGIHRKHNEDEKRKLVGDFVYEHVKVIDSNVLKSKLIGTTSRGTPVEVFEEVLDSEILIVTGNIEYHYFAGYSGGAKAIMPGICTRNSIQFNHSMMLEEGAVAGNFLSNPVRQDIEEAGKLAGIDFIFNVILDDKKNIIAAVAGNNNEAYLEGIKKYDSIYRKEVEEAADIVITSQGGYPKDLNLYQSQKALENVKEIVAENGTIILAASCCEGFGEDIFEQWMANCRDYKSISEKLKKKFVLGGHKAVAVARLLTRAEVLLYSNFNRNETEKMGFKKIEDIQGYLDSRIFQNTKIRITIVPTGRFVRLKK
ncbi:MAG: nickel-dependent lactate racemase [Actinobacteria bacterium]|nr:nickel-dependent lactate racemase [Actinomycetota bacterium]